MKKEEKKANLWKMKAEEKKAVLGLLETSCQI